MALIKPPLPGLQEDTLKAKAFGTMGLLNFMVWWSLSRLVVVEWLSKVVGQIGRLVISCNKIIIYIYISIQRTKIYSIAIR